MPVDSLENGFATTQHQQLGRCTNNNKMACAEPPYYSLLSSLSVGLSLCPSVATRSLRGMESIEGLGAAWLQGGGISLGRHWGYFCAKLGRLAHSFLCSFLLFLSVTRTGSSHNTCGLRTGSISGRLAIPDVRAECFLQELSIEFTCPETSSGYSWI